LLLVGGSARANGRFPGANQLFVDPSEPSHIVTRATFGFVVSVDRGAHWSWICEEVVSPDEALLDPATVVTGDGTLIVGTPHGPAASTDRGCGWNVDAPLLADHEVIDFTIDRQSPGHVWSVFTEFTDTGESTAFALSTDNGKTWEVKGRQPDFYATTVDVAPSSAARMYAADSKGNVARSDDGGQKWALVTRPTTQTVPAYVTAIDPTRPDRVYLRVSEAPGKLMVSDDGGGQWTTIFTDTSPLLGVAVSPDGSQIAVGSAGSGLQVSTTSSFSFQQVNPVAPTCLTWTAEGLYVCGDEMTAHFTIGLSSDGGANISPVLHLGDVVPLDCPASSMTGSVCPAVWCDSIRESLSAAAGCGAGSDPDAAGAGGANGQVDASDAGGSPPDASSPNIDAGGGMSSDGGREGPERPSDGGCQCAVEDGTAPGTALSMAVVASAVGLARRRRRPARRR
jgi:MYXO-CTERM domain-containing protein